MVTLTFDLMTPKYIGFFPFHRRIMWPGLVKIRHTELKLLCGNLCGRPPAIPNHIIRPVSRRAFKNVKNNKYYNSVYAVICTAVVLKEISSKKCTLYLKDLKKKNLVSDKLNTLCIYMR